MIFLPKGVNQHKYCIDVLEREIVRQNLEVLGWREVPVNPEHLGEIAESTEPYIRQIFVGKKEELTAGSIQRENVRGAQNCRARNSQFKTQASLPVLHPKLFNEYIDIQGFADTRRHQELLCGPVRS